MQVKLKIEKLCKATSCEDIAARKARAFVSEVIVMVGPACLRARRIRLSGGIDIDTWSRELIMTKMSSTPIPSMIRGIGSFASVFFHPRA